MAELIHEHQRHIHTPDGLAYIAKTYAKERADGMWEGWLEFVPADHHAPRLKTDRETTQASREAIESWALGLEGAYLEGAFSRATLR